MDACRVHVTGASGAGVTTLGRALADTVASPHHDTDDYFWLPTEPPFRDARPIEERLDLMRALFLPRSSWVLSGSLVGWGDPLIPFFDAVVFVDTPTPLRLERLRDREARRYGAEAIGPGGGLHEAAKAFLDWAAHYEDGSREGRTRERHEAWLAAMPCAVIRVDGARPLSDLVDSVARAVDGR